MQAGNENRAYAANRGSGNKTLTLRSDGGAAAVSEVMGKVHADCSGGANAGSGVQPRVETGVASHGHPSPRSKVASGSLSGESEERGTLVGTRCDESDTGNVVGAVRWVVGGWGQPEGC